MNNREQWLDWIEDKHFKLLNRVRMTVFGHGRVGNNFIAGMI